MTELLRDQTFVHFGRRVDANASRLATVAGGAVITGAQSGGSVDALFRGNVPVILQDDGRALEEIGTLFSPEELWLQSQRNRAVLYTNPVRFVPSRHADARSDPDAEGILATAVEEANRFRRFLEENQLGDPLTVFALHHHWVSRDASAVVSMLRQVDGAVAIMLWHARDPLENPKALEGVLELIRERGDVGMMRTDLGGIGLQANGALFSSIGVGTGTRHYTQKGWSGTANIEDKSPRLLVEPFLAWWKGSRIAQAGPDPLLVCTSGPCGGSELARFADPALSGEAAEHSVTCWTSLSADMRAVQQSQRADWWITKVTEGLARLQELEDRIYLPEPPSKQLQAWCEVVGAPAP